MSSARTIRFTGTGTVPSRRISPNVALKNALASGLLALHVTLRDNEVITHLAEKFIEQFVLLKSKEKARLKFESETYVPLSCQIAVDLKGSRAVSKSDKFTALQKRLETLTTTFKTATAVVFKEACDLEIKNIRLSLMKTVVKFADLLMKQRLLTNDVCREHKKSTELTIMVFLTEALPPVDIHMGQHHDNEPGIDVPLYREMLKLVFKTEKEEIYTFLNEKSNPGNQPDALTETEKGLITQVQNDLKVCFTHCINSYIKKTNDRKLESETKELMLITATVAAGDDTNEEMDEDGNKNNNAALPDTVEKINDLIKAAIIAHDNEKRKKPNSLVKDKRGAAEKKKKQTNGGGASQSKRNQNKHQKSTTRQSSSSKKTPTKSKNHPNSRGRRRRGKAGAVDSDTARTDQHGKRQRSTDRSD